MSGNPFLGLLSDGAVSAPEQPTQAPVINVLEAKIHSLIEQVFMITVDKVPSKNKQLIYIEEIAPQLPSKLFNIDILGEALFERLLLQTPADFIIPNDVKSAEHHDIIETRVVHYLFGAFVRSTRLLNTSDSINQQTIKSIQELILRNVSTAIRQPHLYEGQTFSTQLLDVLKTSEDFPSKERFLSDLVKEILAENDTDDFQSLLNVVNPMLTQISLECEKASMITLEKWILPVLMIFVSDKSNSRMAELLMDFATPVSVPGQPATGVKYANTIFGHLLRISILPKNQNGPYEYYDNIMDSQSSTMNQSLWNYLKMHLDAIAALMKGFLVIGGSTRDKMLDWIGKCLHGNVARGQLWNAHNPAAGMFGAISTASDSFMIGLAGVMLRLCKPLLKPGLKVMLVDPTYCAVLEDARESSQIHMIDAHKETCLIPTDENEKRATTEKYNFITECFFMTHKALDLSK